MEAASILYCVVFPADTLCTINKVIQEISPTENCFCQVTCPTPHPSTATTHSKSVWTVSLFFSVLVVPCHNGCFNPAMAARSANNNANVFLYVFHVPAHSPIRWQHQTVFFLSCLPKITSSQVLNSVSQQRYIVLHFHPSCHLQDCTVFLIRVLKLTFAAWQNQGVGALWNPVIGSVKDIGEKGNTEHRPYLNVGSFIFITFWVSWITAIPGLIQQVTVNSLDWAHKC